MSVFTDSASTEEFSNKFLGAPASLEYPLRCSTILATLVVLCSSHNNVRLLCSVIYHALTQRVLNVGFLFVVLASRLLAFLLHPLSASRKPTRSKFCILISFRAQTLKTQISVNREFLGQVRPISLTQKNYWFLDQPISQKTKNLDAAKRPTNNHVPDLDCETGTK